MIKIRRKIAATMGQASGQYAVECLEEKELQCIRFQLASEEVCGGDFP